MANFPVKKEFSIADETTLSQITVLKLHLLLFISRKYTIINANLKLINVKIHSFYSIDIH